ncbi:D123-domain-containing protein [Gloeopeniophorella convolvens]|nr:D123-domain-containing protein [Gloeopeniophorella convolvens]
MSSADDSAIFPPLTREDVLAFQFSSWYPTFSSLSIKSTIVPLDDDFKAYLESDGVFVPKGSENQRRGRGRRQRRRGPRGQYAFPALDAHIRAAVAAHGAVFPKLNFSAPRDAAWLLPASSPLKCTAPADVYLLLKASDYVAHDLSAASVFAGCVDGDGDSGGGGGGRRYTLELVLRKWFAMDRSREMRAFVRRGALVGISQRDTNYYDFLNEPATRAKIAASVAAYWAAHVRPRWAGPDSYTLDVLLTRDLARFHVLDFNPYAPRTDALLFTYAELAALQGGVPVLRVIDSRAHPAATRNTPEHQHNMVPLEALALSEGRSAEEFAAAWMEQVRRGAVDSSDESGDDDDD